MFESDQETMKIVITFKSHIVNHLFSCNSDKEIYSHFFFLYNRQSFALEQEEL